MAQAPSAQAINRRGKNEDHLTCGTDRVDEVSMIFILSLIVCLTSSGTIFIHEERLQISEAGRKQNESI